MIERKQEAIAAELERRVAEGVYTDKLPTGLELAAEFGVNFKTLNKAVAQLEKRGLLRRKSGQGTFVVHKAERVEDSLVELLFVGSAEMPGHPFYSQMWRGLLSSLEGSGFRLVLNMLEEDKARGGLKEVCRDLTPAAGRLLVGTASPAQVRALERGKAPFLLVGEKAADPATPCVYCDVTTAVKAALRRLRSGGAQDIAFIGATRDDGGQQLDLLKFHAYLAAVQERGCLDSALIEEAAPFAALGREAMRRILARKRPQAVLVAYDHLCPGVYEAIREANLEIPRDISVVGIDGTHPNVSPALCSVEIDRHEIGRRAGETLLEMIRSPGKRRPPAIVLEASFDPAAGGSLR